jgi:GT2 family glycosyltransferase
VFTPFVRARTCFAQVAEVETVTGCAVLVPLGVWTALGGFDPKYAMYFEDFDFTLRAKERGIRTYVVPDSELRVLHHVSGSFREAGAWSKQYLMLTSSLIFVRSHFRGIRKPVCIGLCSVHLALTWFRSLPALPDARRLWRAFVRGWEGKAGGE